MAHGLHSAQDGCECSPTQNHKFTENLFFACQFSLMFVYLMCSPRQLFFHCGPEMTKGCKILKKGVQNLSELKCLKYKRMFFF